MRFDRVCAIGLVLLITACSREDAFTRHVAARARGYAGIKKVEIVERLHLKLTLASDKTHEMYLDNLCRDCAAQGGKCDKGIDRALRLATQGQAYDAAYLKAESVRAVLKDPVWMRNTDKLMAQTTPDKVEGARLVRRPFAAGLSIVYVFDLPDGMRMINRDNMRELKLDEDGLHALAVKNLEAGVPVPVGAPVEAGSTVRLVHVGDSYEASNLILHDRWRKIAQQVKGDLIVAVPTRDYVYFTGSQEDVTRLRALALEDDEKDSHPLTSTLLRWTPDGWEPHP
jgi:hypothetical protein